MAQPPSMSGTVAQPVVTTAPESPYVQPSFNYALRIWWAFFWPLNVMATVLTFGLTAAGYALYQGFHMSAAPLKYGLMVGPFLITYALALPVMFYILGKNFRHFRVGLVASGNFEHPQPVPRTMGRVARVWFAYSWRTLIYGLIAAFVTSLPLGAIAGAFSRMPAVAGSLRFLFGIAINGAVGLYVIYNNIIDENFGDARVTLLPRGPEPAPPQPQVTPVAPPVAS
jgi:hypothetical protein